MLSRSSIIECIEQGLIHYDPLPDDLEECQDIDNTSILLSLGTNIWLPYKDLQLNDITHGISPRHYSQHDKITIPALSSILVHTEEFVGSRSPFLNTQVIPTSELTTLGLLTNIAHGDPGYCSRWTMRLFNSCPYPVVLKPGQKLFQAVFSEVDYPSFDDAIEGEPVPIISPLYEGFRNQLRESWNINCMVQIKPYTQYS